MVPGFHRSQRPGPLSAVAYAPSATPARCLSEMGSEGRHSELGPQDPSQAIPGGLCVPPSHGFCDHVEAHCWLELWTV